MRNGIDVSGFSEIVDEVTNNPREAQFRYAADAIWEASGGTLAKVRPARIGTLRAPREFEVPMKPTPAAQTKNALPQATPEELAIVALSGCFLVSVVSGLTVQRCTIETIAMETELAIDEASKKSAAARFNILSRTDKGSEPTIAVSETVKSVSPNYRTFSESLQITCTLGDKVLHFDPIEPETNSASSFDKAVSLTCHWFYGTQLRAELIGADGKVTQYPIDQPKQLGGVDWAPNPQEYLLMALSSDVLNGLVTKLSHSPAFDGLGVKASARVDIRGMCGIDGVPVHLQDVVLDITPKTDDAETLRALQEVLPDVIKTSRICYLIRQKMHQDTLTVS
jgi:uncharacterized OsmC-like protein